MSVIEPSWDRWTYAAQLVSVYDGDTVRVRCDVGFDLGFTLSLRLLGIQTPEIGGAGITPEERAAGLEAREALLGLIGDHPLIVRTKKDTREGRGRYLATLYAVQYNGLWLDLCADLIDAGYAVAYDGKGKAPKWTPAGWVAAS